MRLSDRIILWLAWHLPKRLVYWCAVRVMAHATTKTWSSQEVPSLYAMDALKRWEDA